jgi:ubiquinone/menaquinone biosynthesis C-methylase UbiE
MDNEKYYESFDWSSFKDSSSNFKIIAQLIPEDVNSILDIGCGNGLITNELAKKYQVVGVDRSKAALEFVKGDKIEASCDSVPVEDQSFDMVLSSELLEHLDAPTFEKTIKELERISKKYILVGVPNQESLIKGLTVCPECKTQFHNCYHQQSFNSVKIENLFNNYNLVQAIECGIQVRSYSNFLYSIKKRIVPSKYVEPYYWTHKKRHQPFCPKCEKQLKMPVNFNFLSFFIDSLNSLISKKKKFHLIALLEKKN